MYSTRKKIENIKNLMRILNFSKQEICIILTLYPAISWVTPGKGPTVARFILSCTVTKNHFDGKRCPIQLSEE